MIISSRKKPLSPTSKHLLCVGIIMLVTGPLYLSTLQHFIPPLDSAEFFGVVASNGVAHPPGYPLLSLLGLLFTAFPAFSFASKLNFVSCFFGILTIQLCYVFLFCITRSRRVALCAAFFLAFSSVFWFFSTLIEVQTLHSSIIMMILLSLLRFSQTQSPNWLYCTAFFFGLGGCHLHTIIFLVPPAVLFLFYHRTILPSHPKVILSLLAWALLGLTPYIYLPLAAMADPVVNRGNPVTISAFLDVFFRRAYGSFSLTQYATGNRWFHFIEQLHTLFFASIKDSFLLGWAIIAAGCIHAASAYRDWLTTWLLFLFGAIVLFLFIANVPATPLFVDVLKKQLAPLLLAQAFFFGLGVHYLLRRTRQQPLILTIVFALLVAMAAINKNKASHATPDLVQRVALCILNTVEPNAILFNGYDTLHFALEYFVASQPAFKNIRPITFLMGHSEAHAVRQQFQAYDLPSTSYSKALSLALIKEAFPHRPIYFTFASKIQNQFHLEAIQAHLLPKGLVYRFKPNASTSDIQTMLSLGLRHMHAYNLHTLRADTQRDYGSKEVVRWVSDAYYNAGIMQNRIGNTNQAKQLMSLSRTVYPR